MKKTKVKVYSTPVCPWCVKAKKFLKEHKIEFEDINIAADIKARLEVYNKTKQEGVPVIEIGDTIIVGYDEDAMKEALDIE